MKKNYISFFTLLFLSVQTDAQVVSPPVEDKQDSTIVFTKVEQEASFPGGSQAWMQYLQDNVSFPERYQLKNSHKVVVLISFIVNESGNIEDAFVSVPFADPFDQIALKVIRQSPRWQPAIRHNRPVKSYYRQPVTFAMAE